MKDLCDSCLNDLVFSGEQCLENVDGEEDEKLLQLRDK